MTIVGLDDTDSRRHGMCTTYVAVRVAKRLREAGGVVGRPRLVRLNPAVEYKTRGNAALAVPTDLSPANAFEPARETVETLALAEEPRTSPGVIVAGIDEPNPKAIPDDLVEFTRRGFREQLTLDEAITIIDDHGWHHAGYSGGDDESQTGRGRIGGLAAIGAIGAVTEWTYEHISYRHADRRGTPRQVDSDSVFAAADWGYPRVWDTVDRGEGEAVCVPAAPGPILHGIRGDTPEACRAVARQIASEPIERTATFLTNQGTDAHVTRGRVGQLDDAAGYRIDGVVDSPPETRQGGHVFFELADSGTDTVVDCVAFEPTKRFRDHVRALRCGDRLTVCGEHDSGTMKLEKFAVRHLVQTERVNPTCSVCGRSMASAGRNQGYRCRDCDTETEKKSSRRLQRNLKEGWYEVPPCARRHIAKPLVRGGFDASTHPER